MWNTLKGLEYWESCAWSLDVTSAKDQMSTKEWAATEAQISWRWEWHIQAYYQYNTACFSNDLTIYVEVPLKDISACRCDLWNYGADKSEHLFTCMF